jgi:hypothetical protein
MFFRRLLYYVQFGALIVLPLWVFAGRALFGVYLGWHFLYQCFIAPLAFLVLLATLLLTLARPEVREERAVSRLDSIILRFAYLFGAAYGFFMIDAPVAGERGSSVFTQLAGLDLNVLSYTVSNTVGPLAAVLALTALWSALRQLPHDVRERIGDRISGLIHPLRSN